MTVHEALMVAFGDRPLTESQCRVLMILDASQSMQVEVLPGREQNFIKGLKELPGILERNPGVEEFVLKFLTSVAAARRQEDLSRN